MRILAMVLFALALAKVGLIQHLRQAGARDVIVAAYGADAVKACETSDNAIKLAGVSPSSIQMVVGDRAHGVRLWQVDHSDWAGRYRHVYLDVVTPEGRVCRFDVAAGKVRPGTHVMAGRAL